MAIAPTGAIYKSLVFDGEDSRNYGVYITGEAVYNAPGRDVEMVEIPGRNGSFALDKGRFQNIEVSYPAGIFADNEADFAEAISDFRNFLCSRKGYVRLTDEYNPSEYRMAIYKSGLEVSPAQLRAGEFEITFDCKPQRWLTSGETAVSVSSGGTLTNPTLFESSPLLESTGYGNILVNGEKITIGSLPYGKIIIANGITDEFRSPLVYTPTDIDVSRLNVGDTFVVKGMTVTTQTSLDDPLITSYEESITALTNCTGYVSGDGETWSLTMNDTQFVYGTSKTVNAQMAVEVKEIYNGNPVITTYTWDADIRYNGSSILYFEANRTFVGTIVSSTLSVEPIYANSTVLATNLTMFIDLDLGEAWNNDGDTIASLNNVVQLPAQLPTLKSGINSISFDGTITSLKITPRWWKA